MPGFDFFICHASEDKDEVAKPLADRLIVRGYAVFYDEYSIALGDSLRETIDRGLAASRFGVVVLSPHFFAKQWTHEELSGLFARETINRARHILPVWHNVDAKSVAAASPMLADRKGVSTSEGLEKVTNAIVARVGGVPSAASQQIAAVLPPVLLTDHGRQLLPGIHESMRKAHGLAQVLVSALGYANEPPKAEQLRAVLVAAHELAEKIAQAEIHLPRSTHERLERYVQLIVAAARNFELYLESYRHDRQTARSAQQTSRTHVNEAATALSSEIVDDFRTLLASSLGPQSATGAAGLRTVRDTFISLAIGDQVSDELGQVFTVVQIQRLSSAAPTDLIRISEAGGASWTITSPRFGDYRVVPRVERTRT
jgi:hypothetical protein